MTTTDSYEQRPGGASVGPHPAPGAADTGIGSRVVAAPAGPARNPRPPIGSEVLLAGASEVQIVHRGVLYRLRQTALGKLILTK